MSYEQSHPLLYFILYTVICILYITLVISTAEEKNRSKINWLIICSFFPLLGFLVLMGISPKPAKPKKSKGYKPTFY